MSGASNNTCCTNPPNPWLPGSQLQGCVCNQECVEIESKVERYLLEYPQVKSIPAEVAYLDSKAEAFSNDILKVNRALNTALISPKSYKESVEAIFYQNAAAAVNSANAALIIAPQTAAVEAASSAMAAITTSRLAYTAATNAKAAADSIINLSLSQIASLMVNVKISTDAVVSAATNSSSVSQSVYFNAESVKSTAQNSLTEANNLLKDAELATSLASCNAVPGSSAAILTWKNNNIRITRAKREVELSTIALKSASGAVDACRSVAISTAAALAAANTASLNTNTANIFFTNATAATAAYNLALQLYQEDSSNNVLLAAVNAASDEMIYRNAQLPPISAMNNMVSSTAEASYLANIAAANARTLSTSLEINAKAIARPTHNPVTPQMIATQTAAAERFGAEAAAAAARLARTSATPAITPPLPPHSHAEYSARVPRSRR